MRKHTSDRSRQPHRVRAIASGVETLHPRRVQRLRVAEVVVQILGVAAAAAQRGLLELRQAVQWELGAAVVAGLMFLTVSLLFRYKWSRVQTTFLRSHRPLFWLSAIWIVGSVAAVIYGGHFSPWLREGWPRLRAFLLWSDICLVVRGLLGAIVITRRATTVVGNPALLLVLSFGVLISIGTILLMLPRTYADPATLQADLADRFRIALFTATSASCVTGLVVVDTGGPHAYWSEVGHVVILGLFQVGGLGIMMFGAFFAIAAGRHMPIKESAALQELLESDRLGDVRRLVLAVLAFTLVSELVGAVLMSGLWADLPWTQRVFYSVFHSISAFCNAGFALAPESFTGSETRWQVWGVMTSLVIVGGLGFAVLYNVVLVLGSRSWRFEDKPLFGLSRVGARLTLTSRLVLFTTTLLLAVGVIGYFVLESLGGGPSPTFPRRLANAWFQSVVFRTAGFNTVDIGALQPATKLLGIILMFIGASPGSTGGGIKTIAFALAALGVISILFGRQRIEVSGRTIPAVLLNRALAIIALGLATVMATTMLLVVFERRPEKFLDHMFETTSAFATVGLSSINTATLTPPSQYVIAATMFLGRVGPLTLIIALAGRMRDTRYDYPVERVTLG